MKLTIKPLKIKSRSQLYRRLPSACLLGCVMFTLPHFSFGQEDTTKIIPDGTEGEMLEVVKTDTLPTDLKKDRWRLFPGKVTSFKLGGGFLYDFVAYSQDDISKRQTDSLGKVLEPTFAVRDFRLTISGQFRTKRTISWKAGLLYDGTSRTWLVRETGLMVGVPELWGSIFVGRTKEGFSLNKVMVGYGGWTMERQMAIDVIPILADGVKWLGYLPKKRIFWNVGIYADWFSKGQSFSTYKSQFAARIGWLPIYSDKTVLHTGINYRYGKVANGEINLRSRPESNPSPYFIETGKFSADRSNSYGAEVYYRPGSLMLGSEIYRHQFHSTQKDNPVFIGGDAVVSYILTGEIRPYYTSTGIFGFVPVKRPVFKGGPGAWEVLVKFSTYELNGSIMKGGKLWKITPMVNWYLTRYLRLEICYGYGVLDRFNMKGATHFFQSRIQLVF